MKRLFILLLFLFWHVDAFCWACPCNFKPIEDPGTLDQVLKACGKPYRTVNYQVTVGQGNTNSYGTQLGNINGYQGNYTSQNVSNTQERSVEAKRIITITKFDYGCPRGVITFEDGQLSQYQGT